MCEVSVLPIHGIQELRALLSLQVDCTSHLGIPVYSLPCSHWLQAQANLDSCMYFDPHRRNFVAANRVLHPQIPVSHSAQHGMGHNSSLHLSWMSPQMAIGQ